MEIEEHKSNDNFENFTLPSNNNEKKKEKILKQKKS